MLIYMELLQTMNDKEAAPKDITSHYWQVDEPIGNKFGYIGRITNTIFITNNQQIG